MHIGCRGSGTAQFPAGGFDISTKKCYNFFYQALDIYQRMPGENLRQPIGEIAGQAFSRSFVQLYFKEETVLCSIIIIKCQAYIIGPLISITVKGFKEFIGPLQRQ